MKTINLQYTTFTTPLPDFIYEGLKEFSANANGYKPQPMVLVDKLAQKYHLPKKIGRHSQKFKLRHKPEKMIKRLVLL